VSCPRILHTPSGPTSKPSTSPNHSTRPPAHPLPSPTYTSTSKELRYTGLAVPDQILCVLVNFFTIALKSPAHAQILHFLAQLGVVLPFTVERTRDNRSILISQFLIVTACQLKGAGMTTPLGYLLTICGHLVRPRVRPLGICPTERNDGRYPKLVLDRLLAALSVVDELDPSALSPRRIFPPSSSSSSKPGSRSSLFKSTLYTLSTVAAIAH